MNYFAYGSNMSLARIQKRCPSAKVICVAVMRNHELCFDKPSSDGSAKANVRKQKGANVYGVIYAIHNQDIPNLDIAEGEGVHYQRKQHRFVTAFGTIIKAQVYVAMKVTKDTIHPYTWYMQHITKGAAENNLPGVYQDMLKSVKTINPKEPKKFKKFKKSTCTSSKIQQMCLFPSAAVVASDMYDESELDDYLFDSFYDYSDVDVGCFDGMRKTLTYTLTEQQTMLCVYGMEHEVKMDIFEELGIFDWTETRIPGADSLEVMYPDGGVAFCLYALY